MRTKFDPTDIRYIKLGSGGAYVNAALDQGIIPLAFPLADHQLCVAGDWTELGVQMIARARSKKAIQQDIRELRDFYELPAGSLWITMARGYLWWALAGDEIKAAKPDAAGPVRWRSTQDGWHSAALTGTPLSLQTLSSVLTRTSSYRRTICKVHAEDYLMRRIRGENHPLYEHAGTLQAEMTDLADQMIRELHWAELETLIDLIFTRNGWRRTSLLGGNMPDVDLILEQPLTGETAWVQVKTGSQQGELEDYMARFKANGSCDRFIYACASPCGALRLPDGLDRAHGAARARFRLR